MTKPIAGASTGINPILLQAANEAAATKDDLRAFISGNDLKVLAEKDMARGGFWPKDERLPIGIPDLFMRKALGLSPQAVLMALSENGIEKLDGQRVEVFHDPLAPNDKVPGGRGKNFVRVFTPNPIGTSDFDGNPASNVNLPGKWLEISPKTPVVKAPVDSNAPHKSIGERAADGVGRLSSDPRSSHLKAILGDVVQLRAADGNATDPKEIAKQIMLANAPGAKNGPSKLKVTSYKLAAASLGDDDKTKDGQIDWAKPGVKEKVAGRAGMFEMGMLGNAVRTLDPNYKDLNQIATAVTLAVNASDQATPGKPTAISNPAFKSELAGLVGGKFVATEAPELIGNGRNEDALKTRLDVIKGAKSDINYAMWKFYPDSVGKQTTDELSAAAKRGVKVNVIVDGNVSSRDAGETAMLQKMRDAGVNVVEARDPTPANAMNGMHAKMILADCSAEAIAKGLTPTRLATDRNDGEQYLNNIGDPNSGAKGWSGNDMVFKGAGAAEGMRAFTNLFNQWAPAGQKVSETSVPTAADLAKAQAGRPTEGEVLSITDVPGPNNKQNISRAIEKLTNSLQAGEKLEINQAYFMGLPGIEKAITAAMKRGVNVEIITNSAESCDVPGISIGTNAVLERLNNEARALATAPRGPQDPKPGTLAMNAYVGKQTLHDKMIGFGDRAVMRMSWNQHGRSQELESEDADIIFSQKAAAAAAANFAKVKEHTVAIKAPALTPEERSAAEALRGLAMDLM